MGMPRRRARFDGYIAGWGTASGTRFVLGDWRRSPYGPFSDVMMESPDGTRTLLAPPEVAEFVADTYRFDAVTVTPVSVRRGDGDPGSIWTVAAGALELRFEVGRRSWPGYLLRGVPSAMARRPAWIALIDICARPVMPGVRTRGTAGRGRREWYGALDVHHITRATAVLDGTDLGEMGPVVPPVRFGFGSTPPAPSLVRVVTTVEMSGVGRTVGG
ncbi:MAG TPA: hypothetical protein VGF84_21945 [Micromonosporaceae bacterium]